MMQIEHSNRDGMPKYTNRLAAETSPYLKQHAHNPVDWYPWGNEALERARAEKKPVHLSVGYSACRWCHVLERESFEDEETARILNEHFINIKVDREERPDIDRIYQVAQQMLTQRGGGWPLTMFLTHDDQRPFFGGTYFPKEARYGLPAFKDLLLRVAEFYRQRAAQLRPQNEALMAAFADLNPQPAGPDSELTQAPLASLREQLARSFDPRYGGFGGAPKSPHPRTSEWLLRRWQASAGAPEPDLEARHMATLTLRRMAEGGINDQLGGGFCRYSVDEYWMIPHFEKMLYDNGALLAVYAQAALATGDPSHARVRWIAGGERRLRINREQRAVVVQHLLEVRDHPVLVDRVAAESATQLVVDTALGHAAQRERRHVPGLEVRLGRAGARLPAPEQPLDGLRVRELRCAAETPVAGIEAARELLAQARERGPRELAVGARRLRVEIREGRHERLVLRAQLRGALPVELGDPEQQVLERRQPVARFLRKVGASEERPLIVVCEEHGERPAAAALRKHLLRHLVDAIDVRTLLAVDLDVDEVVVEDASRLFVFETFSLENVAPPAGGITHTQMNRLFFGACSFECFIAPRIPIDGIVSVLLQVRTRLGGEAVGVLRHAVSIGMLDLHHDSRSIDSQHCLRRSCRFVCSGSDRRQRCPEYPHPASLLASCHLTRQCDRHVIIARWSVAAFAYRTRVLAGVLGRLGILRVPVSPPRIPCQTRKPCMPTLPTPRRASCA